MSRTPNSNHSTGKYSTLLFHQVNIGKGGPNMDTALQQVWDAEAHVVMVQEPWTMQIDGDFITKSHPGLEDHKPVGETRNRPRAITFTRKSISATQIFSAHRPTSDYCFVNVDGLTFANVYCAPGPSRSLEPLLQWRPLGPTVVGGTSTRCQYTGNHRLHVSISTVIRSWNGSWLMTCTLSL